jgi:cyclophilin family peptidyl-prolyl cis-trans isomerase
MWRALGCPSILQRRFSLAKQYTQAPDLQIDPRKKYTAIFHTVKGDIKVELFAAQAPITVNNFVFLAREGFYNNTTFHRVIGGFMAQGGDPTATGTGGPGYKFNDEPGALAIPHDRAGILSMANAGRNTNGSQFFITHGPTSHLNGKHGVFGHVTEGMDVLRSIRERDPQRDRNPGDALVAIDIVES